ncbi:MAG: hypothetical protein J0H68_03830 [Sphingobacteriia bacterium]|nr:hypothetical protein [Sphingobacteriia bacterium]
MLINDINSFKHTFNNQNFFLSLIINEEITTKNIELVKDFILAQPKAEVIIFTKPNLEPNLLFEILASLEKEERPTLFNFVDEATYKSYDVYFNIVLGSHLKFCKLSREKCLNVILIDEPYYFSLTILKDFTFEVAAEVASNLNDKVKEIIYCGSFGNNSNNPNLSVNILTHFKILMCYLNNYCNVNVVRFNNQKITNEHYQNIVDYIESLKVPSTIKHTYMEDLYVEQNFEPTHGYSVNIDNLVNNLFTNPNYPNLLLTLKQTVVNNETNLNTPFYNQILQIIYINFNSFENEYKNAILISLARFKAFTLEHIRERYGNVIPILLTKTINSKWFHEELVQNGVATLINENNPPKLSNLMLNNEFEKVNLCVQFNKTAFPLEVTPIQAKAKNFRHKNGKDSISTNLKNRVIKPVRTKFIELTENYIEKSRIK